MSHFAVERAQRKRLLEGVSLTECCKELIKKGDIASIDIVGSIRGKDTKQEYDKETAVEHMMNLFNYAADNSVNITAHAFEVVKGENEGVFYDALRKAIELNVKPLYIEFGHIAYVTPEWITIIQSNESVKPFFNVNVQSNLQLTGVSLKDLQEQVILIQEAGFPVFIGSDGRGILQNSSYREQSTLLNLETAQKERYLDFY